MSLLRDMKDGEFDAVYDLMLRSFPRSEFRSREGQLALFDRDVYKLLVADEGGLCGLLAVWRLERFTFVEHLAVAPEKRNRGLGSRMLSELKSGVPLLLEVDPPKTELARRRIDFYRRNGFTLLPFDYLQPGLAPGLPDVPMCVMYTGGPVGETEFLSLRRELFRGAYDRVI